MEEMHPHSSAALFELKKKKPRSHAQVSKILTIFQYLPFEILLIFCSLVFVCFSAHCWFFCSRHWSPISIFGPQLFCCFLSQCVLVVNFLYLISPLDSDIRCVLCLHSSRNICEELSVKHKTRYFQVSEQTSFQTV